MTESIAPPPAVRPRPSWIAVAIIGSVALSLSTMTGCAGSPAARARQKAPTLEYGRTLEDALHCKKRDCDDWYRLVVQTRRVVEVEVDAPADPALPDFGLSLYDADMTLVGDERAVRTGPRNIRRALAPGLYYVHVWGLGDNRDRLSYKLTLRDLTPRKAGRKRATGASGSSSSTRSRSAPAPTTAEPPPLVGEVIEVERDGGEPTAVLLQLTLSDGIEKGLTGRLVDAGEVIGQLEIVDVYSEGSRARIVGGLSAPITADTKAEIAR